MKEISKEGGPRAARKPGRERQDAIDGQPRSRRSRSRKERGRKSQYALRRGIAVVAAVACFLFAGFAFVDILAGDGGIQRGVRIGDVEVGGMEKVEATAAVEKNAAQTFQEISFGEGEVAVSVKAEDLGVKVNAEVIIDRATVKDAEVAEILRVGKLLYRETNRKRAQGFTMARLLKLMRSGNESGVAPDEDGEQPA